MTESIETPPPPEAPTDLPYRNPDPPEPPADPDVYYFTTRGICPKCHGEEQAQSKLIAAVPHPNGVTRYREHFDMKCKSCGFEYWRLPADVLRPKAKKPEEAKLVGWPLWTVILTAVVSFVVGVLAALGPHR